MNNRLKLFALLALAMGMGSEQCSGFHFGPEEMTLYGHQRTAPQPWAAAPPPEPTRTEADRLRAAAGLSADDMAAIQRYFDQQRAQRDADARDAALAAAAAGGSPVARTPAGMPVADAAKGMMPTAGSPRDSWQGPQPGDTNYALRAPTGPSDSFRADPLESVRSSGSYGPGQQGYALAAPTGPTPRYLATPQPAYEAGDAADALAMRGPARPSSATPAYGRSSSSRSFRGGSRR